MRTVLLTLAALAAPEIGSAGAVIELPCAADNTLYETTGDDRSNGSGSHVFCGTTNGGDIRRAVLRFDPSGLDIDSIKRVALRMRMDRTISGPALVGLHSVSESWGEAGSIAPGEGGEGAPPDSGDATWNHRFYPDLSWSTPGGTFGAVASAATEVDGDGMYTWESITMLADVTGWILDPDTNHGWCVVGSESSSGTAKRFVSREGTDVSARPVLVIELASVSTPVDAVGRAPSVSPVPTRGALHYRGPGSMVRVFDATGRQLARLSVRDGRATWDARVPPGIYWLWDGATRIRVPVLPR